MHEENRNIEETKIILEEWKTVIKTQMHFNEMILRARTTGVSVVMAVYGAAALAIAQYPEKFIKWSCLEFHVSAAIIIFGILLLGSIFCIDFFYYYRLLMGAVEHGETIDNAFKNRTINGKRLFGLTTAITNKVSKCSAQIWLIIFYAIPFAVGAISLIYLFWFYRPNFR
jgi:hypothetical protein